MIRRPHYKTLQDEKATDIHIVPTHLVGMLGLADTATYDLEQREADPLCGFPYAV